VVKCPNCNRRINSTYIREGQKALWKKIGYFCAICNVHYDMKLKPYVKERKGIADNNRRRVLLNAV
jgi:hypothetical protein